MNQSDEKPTNQQIFEAADKFESLKFFPAGSAAAKEVVMKVMDSMIATQGQLAWFMDAQINRVGEWHGPAQMRALFNTRFPSADGIEGEDCALIGFTPAECEASYYERKAVETDRMLAAAAKDAQKLLGPAEPLDFVVPVKQIAPIKLSRTERDLRDRETRQRLASSAGQAADPKPMPVAATRQRTPEENEQIVRETEAELERRRMAR